MSKPPVRGTQSFVGVMAEVWKRPSLTGIEIAWRWVFGAPLLALLASVTLRAMGLDPHWSAASFESAFAQAESYFTVLMHGGFIVRFAGGLALFSSLKMVCGVAVVWAGWSAVGRTLLLRRLDRAMRPRPGTLMLLAAMRVFAWGVLVAAWIAMLTWTWIVMVQNPQARGAYPSYVPGFAIVLFTTLALFMFWCLMSWVFRLAAVLAAARGLGVAASLRAAWRSGPLRGKLIEINLVMGIVKVALLVLAMVFSACPLPFQSVETQAFLTWWWAGVAVFYLVASDYFHVVRAIAYVRLWQAYDFLPESGTRDGELAS